MVPLSTVVRSPVGGQDLISKLRVWLAPKNSAWIWNVQTWGWFLVRGVGSAAPLWILTVPGLRLLAVAACAAAKPARTASARTTRASTLRLLILPLAIGPHPLSLRGL